MSEAAAAKFLTASRELGEAVNPTKYPTVATIERETHFNAMNPFWQATFAYGAAVAALAPQPGVRHGRPGRRRSPAITGSTIYRLGLAALAVGIALEIYGFYLRVRIIGLGPGDQHVRDGHLGRAGGRGSVVHLRDDLPQGLHRRWPGRRWRLLGTITAANVPLLDPSIKSLQPVLRSNLWLTIHVLTEVSSYAAFGLAWMLGLIATLYYLTATYRRSPRFSRSGAALDPRAAPPGGRRGRRGRRRTECSARSGRSATRRLFQLAVGHRRRHSRSTCSPPWPCSARPSRWRACSRSAAKS